MRQHRQLKLVFFFNVYPEPIYKPLKFIGAIKHTLYVLTD
jgi:hypothetical protein